MTARTLSPMDGSRDLRIDFIRGVVMFILVVSHIELFSIFNLLTWERVGMVSGAEGFVILAGFVIGMVYGGRVRKTGLAAATNSLFDRALQLYRVNVFIIVSITLLRFFTITNVHEVTTFTDRGAGIVYPLFTAADAPIANHLADILLLRSGPQQIQILGLYVVLLALSPLALALMAAGRTGVVLLLSWVAYVGFWAFDTRLISAQFENAFPILAWQLIYFHGVAAGFHKQSFFSFLGSARGKAVVIGCGVIALALLVFAQNTPNPFIPQWARFDFIPAERFDALRVAWFDKNTLRPGRVLNYVALLIVGYQLLTRFWSLFYRSVGWFFVPIGQASLYVFIVHVYIVMLASNLVPFGFTIPPSHIVLNTIVHVAALGVLWLMVRYQVLYGWIPR